MCPLAVLFYYFLKCYSSQIVLFLGLGVAGGGGEVHQEKRRYWEVSVSQVQCYAYTEVWKLHAKELPFVPL